MIEVMDFLEFDCVMEQLKEEAVRLHPDKTLTPFWHLYVDGDEAVIRATVSDGKVGPQPNFVELRKPLKGTNG